MLYNKSAKSTFHQLHKMLQLVVQQIHNKAITSPALCTPVTPFPPTGDAAYRQRVGGGPSHGRGQHAQKIGKDRTCESGDILSDRQTHRHTARRTHHSTSHRARGSGCAVLVLRCVRLSVCLCVCLSVCRTSNNSK